MSKDPSSIPSSSSPSLGNPKFISKKPPKLDFKKSNKKNNRASYQVEEPPNSLRYGIPGNKSVN